MSSPKHSVIPWEVGSVQEPRVVIQEVDADYQGQVGNINKDQGIISEVDGDAACPKVLDCVVGDSEKRDVGELRSSSVERSRRRGRPRKRRSDPMDKGYSSDSGTIANDGLQSMLLGHVTRSKTKSRVCRNPFSPLSYEDNCLEC